MDGNNPWLVESIEAFSFFKCPECKFDTKKENFFQVHATENHPLSFVFFGKTLNENDFDFVQEVKTENGFVTIEDPLENFNDEISLGIGYEFWVEHSNLSTAVFIDQKDQIILAPGRESWQISGFHMKEAA